MAAGNTDATDATNDKAPPTIETEAEFLAYVREQLGRTYDDVIKAELLTNIALAAFQYASTIFAATDAQRKAALERFYRVTQTFTAPPAAPQWCVIRVTLLGDGVDAEGNPYATREPLFLVRPWIKTQADMVAGPFDARSEAEQWAQQQGSTDDATTP